MIQRVTMASSRPRYVLPTGQDIGSGAVGSVVPGRLARREWRGNGEPGEPVHVSDRKPSGEH